MSRWIGNGHTAFGVWAVWLLIATSAQALDRWGDIRGRFVWTGKPPSRQRIVPNKDAAAFTKPILSESLIVNGNGGVANVLVFLLPEDGQKLRTHPDYRETLKQEVTMRAKDGRIDPHVVLLRTHQTLRRTNQDDVAHNLNIQFFASAPP